MTGTHCEIYTVSRSVTLMSHKCQIMDIRYITLVFLFVEALTVSRYYEIWELVESSSLVVEIGESSALGDSMYLALKKNKWNLVGCG